MTIFKDVSKFHEMGGTHFRETVGIPDDRQIGEVMALLTEEYTETTTGLVIAKNLPEAADGFLDMIYVCNQGLMSLGLKPEEIQILWDEVQEANMSKVDPALGLLDDNDGKPYVNAAGKITKPPGFTPPDIEGLLHKIRRARNNG